MQFIDTHTHLYISQFDEDRSLTIRRAIDNGINKFYLPAIDSSTHNAMLDLEMSYPDTCFAMMGLHPCSVKEDFETELRLVEQWLSKRAFCAIGEIGLDLHWDTTFVAQQKEAFRRQIRWAIDLDIPIVIHSRKATWEVIEILREERHEKLRGIFHCFGGNINEANAIIDCGFFLGIGGVLTFKKAGLDKTMEKVALDYVVLETDSPYLAPTPYRGKRNESAYIRLIAERLAEVKGVSLAEVAKHTTQNANKIFETTSKNTLLYGNTM